MSSVENVPTPPEGIDVSRPSVARMYNAYLGGTHNHAADRVAADAVSAALPNLRNIVAEGRAFLRRSLRYMCHQGIDQIIDIGSGLLTGDNTHQIVQRVIPEARVVYVDIDASAVVQGREIVKGIDNVAFIQGNVLEVEAILDHPEVKKLVDFSRPVGVVMMGLLHFFPTEDCQDILRRLRGSLAAGSLLTFTHGSQEELTPEVKDEINAIYSRVQADLFMRYKAEIQDILQGLDLVEPGLVKVHEWRMEEAEPGEPTIPKSLMWYGVMVKV